MQAALEDALIVEVKKDDEYIREGHVPVRDEIEDQMLKKYKEFKDRGSLDRDEDKVLQLKKVAVVD
jgi:hypothetical protein